MVNGKVVMVLCHNRQPAGDGEKASKRDRVQLQWEGAEVFYKNIKAQNITKLPDGLTQ